MNMIKVLADFAKAAYNLTHIGYFENNVFNDPSPNSFSAYQDILKLGYKPILFSSLKPILDQSGFINYGMTADGFFINRNAAVFAARLGDSVVLSFRGTNDAGKEGENAYDPRDAIHPDKDHWKLMPDHYALLSSYLSLFDNYVQDNGIKNVYVTGHSMGGAMAIEYMYQHPGLKYEAVTFAAAPFGQPYFLVGTERKFYPTDNRLTQIEITNDPGPMAFDIQNLFGDVRIRPGHVLEFQLNQTMDRPNLTEVPFAPDFFARNDNHSMDFYRQVTKSINDLDLAMLDDSPEKQVIFMGGRQIGAEYVVDGLRSGTNQVFDSGADILWSTYGANFISGGRGNDQVLGSALAEKISGGDGDDSINGGAGDDLVSGGIGNDLMDWNSASRGGNDTFYGGKGDDVFVLDSRGDFYHEFANEGNDTAWVNFDYELQDYANIENLRAYGTDGVRIKGNSYNNVLSGAGGNDFVDGGLGIDTVLYDQSIGEFAISRMGNVINLHSKTGKTGDDIVMNVEFIKFANVSLDLSTKTFASTMDKAAVQSVLELYIAFFNRIPDADGVTYWLGQHKAGQSINQIAESFYNAGVHFSNLTGYSKEMTHTAFVNLIYKNVLGRADGGDAIGVTYWSNLLATQKASHGSLVGEMLTSAHGFKGDATWGWVANLLDNKVQVAQTMAISMGINFSSSDIAISQGMKVAAAITATDTQLALSLIGIDYKESYL